MACHASGFDLEGEDKDPVAVGILMGEEATAKSTIRGGAGCRG